MHRKKLIWQLFPSHVLILMAAILSLVWFGTQSVREFHIEQTIDHLKARTLLIEPLLPDLLQKNKRLDLKNACREAARRAGTRVTITDSNGQVLCDTEHDPDKMDNHARRPEIAQALHRKVGTSIRHSATIGTDMVYVAIPIIKNGVTKGILRTAMPVVSIDKMLADIYWQILAASLVVTLVAAAMTLAVAQKISQPLHEMKKGAELFAAGDFSSKVMVSGSEETAGLAKSLNKMASQLDDRIRAVQQQRKELETVFTSMAEGVLTIDGEERIVNLNQAAADMLQVSPAIAAGKKILELIRNIDLLRFIQDALASDTPVERTITFKKDRENEKILQAHGSPLSGGSLRKKTLLIVINDVTRLLRLEKLRRDFVANVSHELKTPITSIKGYVETLLADELDDRQQVRNFLEIIHKQANRLHAIVEDILTLSKIEQEYEKMVIDLEKGGIRPVLANAIEACSAKAAEKKITLRLECPENTQAKINTPLLEQALINLIDNAIKYSQKESSIDVKTEFEENTVLISVRDQGVGIPAEHLPRLFERFYLVDKARSRKLGGTGLGLAIVKHIATAHNALVSVESSPGKGSTFTIRLPA